MDHDHNKPQSVFATLEEITGNALGSKCYAVDGYVYIRNSRWREHTYFKCSQNGCVARVALCDGLFRLTRPHNHHRRDLQIAILKFRQELRESAKKSLKSFRLTYDEVSSRHPLAANYVNYRQASILMHKIRTLFPTETQSRQSRSQSENSTSEQHFEENISCKNMLQSARSEDLQNISQVDTSQVFVNNCSKSVVLRLEAENSMSNGVTCPTFESVSVGPGFKVDDAINNVAHIKQEYMESEVVVKEEAEDPISNEACPTFESVYVSSQMIKEEDQQDCVNIKTEEKDNICSSENTGALSPCTGYQNTPPVVGLSSAVTCSSAPTVSVVTTFPSSTVTTTVSSGSSLISSVSQYPQSNVTEHRTADISSADVKEEMLSKKMKPSAPAEQGQATNNTQQLQFPPSLPFTTSITPDTKMISSLPIVTNLTSPDGTMQYVIINQQPPSNILMFPSQQIVSSPSAFVPPLSTEVSQDTISGLFNPLVQSSTNTLQPVLPLSNITQSVLHPTTVQPPNGQPVIQQPPMKPPIMQSPIVQVPYLQPPNGQLTIEQPPFMQPPFTNHTAAPNNKPVQPFITPTQSGFVYKKPASFHLSSSENHYVETTNMIKIDLSSVSDYLKKGIKSKVRELCDAIFFKDVDPIEIILSFPRSYMIA